VHFSEVRLLGGLNGSHLRSIRTHAAELGLHVEIDMLSMCPLSNLFDASQGSAEEQLSGLIEASRFVGSPIVRAVVGNAKDRRSSTPFAEILGVAVRVLRSVRSRALEFGHKYRHGEPFRRYAGMGTIPGATAVSVSLR
jgi:hypothetical protein